MQAQVEGGRGRLGQGVVGVAGLHPRGDHRRAPGIGGPARLELLQHEALKEPEIGEHRSLRPLHLGIEVRKQRMRRAVERSRRWPEGATTLDKSPIVVVGGGIDACPIPPLAFTSIDR